jgi:hypothetical protein
VLARSSDRPRWGSSLPAQDLGAGHPLFPPADTPLPLKLVETRRFGNGVVLLTYAPRSA